jgi:hypothetical protein
MEFSPNSNLAARFVVSNAVNVYARFLASYCHRARDFLAGANGTGEYANVAPMNVAESTSSWLYPHWVAAALCMGIFLLLLAPALTLSWELPILLIYLQIPVYMLHQVEEHTGDRFRRFVNQQAFGGVEALTPESILVINLPGVWGVTLLSLYAALFFGAGWGLAGIYLVLVNALFHVTGGVAKRAYNPGLWTSLALFLPVGGAALWSVSSTAGVSGAQHAVGLGLAVLIHAAIMIYARDRASKLRASK